jgi:hypothetical protein
LPAGPLARLCSTVSFLQAAKFYYHFSTTDIDECTEGIDNCHQQAMCQNTDGSFNCYCNNGWTGNGTHCTGKEGINWVSHQRIPPIVEVLSWPLAYDKYRTLPSYKWSAVSKRHERQIIKKFLRLLYQKYD